LAEGFKGGTEMAIGEGMNTSTTFTPRVRFNWGFWDAVAAKRDGRRVQDELWISRHFDRAYAKGYSAGKQAEGQPATSDAAWKESR
jgi:Leu/Phe-tRNA-protein transferase